MARRTYHTNTAFLDLLFNTLLAFVGIAAVAMALMNVNKQTKNVDAKADFIITVSWPNTSDSDVDTYVEDPNGKFVFFQRREDGLMHLDRDDLGKSNDTVQTEFGPIEYAENREIVTLRGTIPGEYVVNVHMYLRKDNKSEDVPVTVQVDKINPYSTVAIKRVVLLKNGDEKTAVRFSVNREGDITDVNDLPKSIISGHKQGGNNGPNNEFSNPEYDGS